MAVNHSPHFKLRKIIEVLENELPFSKEPLKIFVLIDFMADTGFA
jgi:hypothetical protein